MARQKKPSGKRSGFGAARPLSALSRRPGRRLPLKRLVIVCEGAETEPLYFHGLRRWHRLSTLSIEVVGGQVSPISVVREAKKHKTKLDDARDEVWCVFDTEIRAQNPSFEKALNLAVSSGLNLAVSNPSFEYWYILHFECTDCPFHGAASALGRLKRHLPHYEKSTPVFEELEPRIPTAVQNAGKLRKGASESWDAFPNPSTSVDKLVLVILKMVDSS